MEPTPEQILEAAKVSGYLMEQDVATTLEKIGFGVQTGRPFKDPDEGKSRELDVRAWKVIHQDGQLTVNLELACECKNSANPLVFLSRKKGAADHVVRPYHVFFPHDAYQREEGNQTYREMPAFEFFGLADVHPWFSSNEKTVQFFKVVREGKNWKANHDGIHDATILPLAKAIVARRKELGDMKRFAHDLVVVLAPLVVVAKEPYLIRTDSGDLTPRAVQHVTFLRSLKSASVEGSFFFEFVAQAHLAEVVTDHLLPFAERLRDRVMGRKLRETRPK